MDSKSAEETKNKKIFESFEDVQSYLSLICKRYLGGPINEADTGVDALTKVACAEFVLEGYYLEANNCIKNKVIDAENRRIAAEAEMASKIRPAQGTEAPTHTIEPISENTKAHLSLAVNEFNEQNK